MRRRTDVSSCRPGITSFHHALGDAPPHRRLLLSPPSLPRRPPSRPTRPSHRLAFSGVRRASSDTFARVRAPARSGSIAHHEVGGAGSPARLACRALRKPRRGAAPRFSRLGSRGAAGIRRFPCRRLRSAACVPRLACLDLRGAADHTHTHTHCPFRRGWRGP